MIRSLALLLAMGALSACGSYRPPSANCFDVVSRGTATVDCNFKPFAGSPQEHPSP